MGDRVNGPSIEGLRVIKWERWQGSAVRRIKAKRAARGSESPVKSLDFLWISSTFSDDFRIMALGLPPGLRPKSDAFLLRILQGVATSSPEDGILRITRDTLGPLVLSRWYDRVSRASGAAVYDALLAAGIVERVTLRDARRDTRGAPAGTPAGTPDGTPAGGPGVGRGKDKDSKPAVDSDSEREGEGKEEGTAGFKSPMGGASEATAEAEEGEAGEAETGDTPPSPPVGEGLLQPSEVYLKALTLIHPEWDTAPPSRAVCLREAARVEKAGVRPSAFVEALRKAKAGAKVWEVSDALVKAAHAAKPLPRPAPRPREGPPPPPDPEAIFKALAKMPADFRRGQHRSLRIVREAGIEIPEEWGIDEAAPSE